MDLSVLTFFIMIAVLVSYVAVIWVKYGIQTSVSESYYVLPYNWKFLFTLFCWGFSLPLAVSCDTLLMFIAAGGFMFVGAAAAYKEQTSRMVHLVAAFVGIGLSQASIFVDMHMWYVNIAFVSSALLLVTLKIKNVLWWVEILAFVSLAYALSLKVF